MQVYPHLKSPYELIVLGWKRDKKKIEIYELYNKTESKLK